jgi:thiosulfate dehydrogenase [quinone] large subunit
MKQQVHSRPRQRQPESPAAALVRASATSWSQATLPAWVLLPLRLFLGVTFVYAGLQKLTDPQYFRPSAIGYIGRQITAFASGSPIRGFLLHVAVPHAAFVGGLVAYGELAIGIGALVGFLLRPAAFFGALMSLIFFLSASWRVYPYFYGADIVFLFGWITILLAGPAAGGWPALDAWLAPRLLERVPPSAAVTAADAMALLLGVRVALPETPVPATSEQGNGRAAGVAVRTRREVPPRTARNARAAAYARAQTRRDFLKGSISGVAATVAVVVLASLFRHGGGDAQVSTTPSAGSTPAAGDATATTGTGATSSGNAIATVSQVPVNSAANFTIPSSGDPGVVVHLSDGKFVAYDATCTHAGCPVQYDPSSQLLLCPCHGAAFDPAHDAAVVQGPAETPLLSVPISVNNSTGAITLSS